MFLIFTILNQMDVFKFVALKIWSTNSIKYA